MNALATQTADLAFREQRRKYIGGSDIAALLGIAPAMWRRNTPYALYVDKTEPPKADTQNLGVKRRGKRWESVVAEMLVEKLQEMGHKVQIVAYNKRYVDPQFEFFACEIDFEIILDDEEEITNVELKTVHPYKVAEWGEEGTDESPVWYTAQGQWGLGITNLISPRRRCIVAPLFGADEIRVYPMDAANDVIADIRETGRKFWTENVIPRVPPPPGNLIDVSKLFPNSVEKAVELSHDLAFVDAIIEMRDLDARWKAIEKRWEEVELIAKAAMGENAVATIGGHKACTWKTQGQTNIDVAKLREKHPAIALEVERHITFRKFLLSKVKEKKK